MSYPALRFLLAIILFCNLTGGLNDTVATTDVTITYTGWHNSPAERGTMTILWSCLATIFACTWAILHLNVPDPKDTTWIKLRKKMKWMAITVVFPEFNICKSGM